jgi:peptidoglycan-N-acetylglucosamine deacetylase
VSDDHTLHASTLRKSLWVLVPAVLAIGALLVGLALTRERPVPVTVNGAAVTLAQGTTVGSLEQSQAFVARPGRLLSVQGSVIATEGGAPATVYVNGRRAEPSRYLYRNDVVVTRNGSDTVEATVTIREPIPVKTRIKGSGPVMRLANPGAVGVRTRTVGEVSKIVVSEQVVTPAQDMVVIKTKPHPKEKLIALTFDDGPWPGQTDKILKILRHEGVRATFFMLGVRVKLAPKLARQVAEDGHQVGNHSLGHRLLTKSKPKEIKRQIKGGADVIYKATGVLPTWFRPPYGAIDKKVWKQVRTQRVHVALWTIDTRDWSHPGVKHIVNTSVKNARSGSILLMHDGGVNRKQTIKALPQVIRKLKKRGFVFVTVEELAAAR